MDREGSRLFPPHEPGNPNLPVAWFMAIEQPVLTILPVGPLSSRDYLSRFGFMYETEKSERGKSQIDKTEYGKSETGHTGLVDCDAINADARQYDLPIGFAIEKEFYAPYANPPISTRTPVVGLTCAACHTGRIEIKLNDGTTKVVSLIPGRVGHDQHIVVPGCGGPCPGLYAVYSRALRPLRPCRIGERPPRHRPRFRETQERTKRLHRVGAGDAELCQGT